MSVEGRQQRCMIMLMYVVYSNSLSYQTIHVSSQIGHWCQDVVDMDVTEAFVVLNVSNSTTSQQSVPVARTDFGSHTELIFFYCIYRGIVLQYHYSQYHLPTPYLAQLVNSWCCNRVPESYSTIDKLCRPG